MTERAFDEETLPALLPADLAPADRLHGAVVVDPTGRRLGAVRMVLRRWDGARLVFVERHFPRTRLVLDLRHGSLDAGGVLHISSRRDVELVPEDEPSVEPCAAAQASGSGGPPKT